MATGIATIESTMTRGIIIGGKAYGIGVDGRFFFSFYSFSFTFFLFFLRRGFLDKVRRLR